VERSLTSRRSLAKGEGVRMEVGGGEKIGGIGKVRRGQKGTGGGPENSYRRNIQTVGSGRSFEGKKGRKRRKGGGKGWEPVGTRTTLNIVELGKKGPRKGTGTEGERKAPISQPKKKHREFNARLDALVKKTEG